MYWQGTVCSGGSQGLGWEGKEVQTGVGRQGHWRGTVVASSQAGKVWLKDYQSEPSRGSQGVAH